MSYSIKFNTYSLYKSLKHSLKTNTQLTFIYINTHYVLLHYKAIKIKVIYTPSNALNDTTFALYDTPPLDLKIILSQTNK